MAGTPVAGWLVDVVAATAATVARRRTATTRNVFDINECPSQKTASKPVFEQILVRPTWQELRKILLKALFFPI